MSRQQKLCFLKVLVLSLRASFDAEWRRVCVFHDLKSHPVSWTWKQTSPSSVCAAFSLRSNKNVVLLESIFSCKVQRRPKVQRSQIWGVALAAARWTDGDALLLAERLDDSCNRRLENLPGESHPAVRWVSAKVFHLFKDVTKQCKRMKIHRGK